MVSKYLIIKGSGSWSFGMTKSSPKEDIKVLTKHKFLFRQSSPNDSKTSYIFQENSCNFHTIPGKYVNSDSLGSMKKERE
jgi:hypothetical protein